jgi:hypothetical protein
MKKVFTDNPLPLDFMGLPLGETIVYQGGIKMSQHSRLQAKVLVFKNRTHLKKFWDKNLRNGLGSRVCAAVNALACECCNPVTGETRMEVDPRFFCVMAFNLKDLSMEIIAHESVHAGFAYARRIGKRTLFENALEFDEEEVAYPAGEIAAELNRVFHDKGFYK